MKRYRIIYSEFDNGKGHLRTTYKASIPSATNLIYKVFASLSKNLLAFSVRDELGEWIDYDFPWVSTHQEVKARLFHLKEFHEAFYDSHQD